MSHIFISYSRKDLAIAEKIIDALAKDDLEPWIDWKSIPKGETFEIEIQQGIEAAKIAKQAQAENKTVKEVALEKGMQKAELDKVFSRKNLLNEQ